MGIFAKKRPMVRLVYVNFEKKYELKNGSTVTSVNEAFSASDPLYVPEDLEFDDVCKMVSYLFEDCSLHTNIDPMSSQGVDYVFKKLYDCGFTSNNDYNPIWYSRIISEKELGKDEQVICKRIPGCVDIFVVGNRDNLFNSTKLSKRFVDWYIPDVDSIEFSRLKAKIKHNKKIR